MVFVIGVTGGIASGKSTVCRILERKLSSIDGYNLVVIDGDKVGHRAYEVDGPCYTALVEHFGPSVVSDDGTRSINRRALGGIVFGDLSQMRVLESIVWPWMRSAIEKQCRDLVAGKETEESSSNTRTIVVFEAAVLLEAGWEDLCDVVWVSYVEPQLARERIMSRNGLSAEEADLRINAQMSNADRFTRLRAQDILLENNRSTEQLEIKVNEELHKTLSKSGASPPFAYLSPTTSKSVNDKNDAPLP